MPKKTKKEKLLAEYHRHAPSPPVVLQVPQSKPAEVSNTTTFTLSNRAVPQTQTLALNQSEFTAIQRDLIKSILLICGIIATELLLSRYLS